MVKTPTWSVDFLDAHQRHWTDAEILNEQNRLANADHLYGMSAECGLKAVMEKLGMPVDSLGPTDKRYKVHINVLWTRFKSFASGRLDSTLVSLLPDTDPFDDWDVNQRYANKTYFTRSWVQQHRSGAERVRALMHEARIRGVL